MRSRSSVSKVTRRCCVYPVYPKWLARSKLNSLDCRRACSASALEPRFIMVRRLRVCCATSSGAPRMPLVTCLRKSFRNLLLFAGPFHNRLGR